MVQTVVYLLYIKVCQALKHMNIFSHVLGRRSWHHRGLTDRFLFDLDIRTYKTNTRLGYDITYMYMYTRVQTNTGTFTCTMSCVYVRCTVGVCLWCAYMYNVHVHYIICKHKGLFTCTMYVYQWYSGRSHPLQVSSKTTFSFFLS